MTWPVWQDLTVALVAWEAGNQYVDRTETQIDGCSFRSGCRRWNSAARGNAAGFISWHGRRQDRVGEHNAVVCQRVARPLLSGRRTRVKLGRGAGYPSRSMCSS